MSLLAVSISLVEGVLRGLPWPSFGPSAVSFGRLGLLGLMSAILPPRASQGTIGDEELPMTMQIGMVGVDGIVLASDTKWLTENIRGGKKYRDVRHDSKIKVSGGIAICCAREMEFSTAVAEAIISQWNGNEGDDSQWVRDAIGPLMKEATNHAWECIVALCKPQKRFIKVLNVQVTDGVSAPGWRLFVSPMLRYCEAGDDANGARYWLRYYDPLLTTKELSTLAAYTIIDAQAFSNAGIGGLELAYSDDSGFHRIPNDECVKFEANARIASDAIRKLVTNP